MNLRNMYHSKRHTDRLSYNDLSVFIDDPNRLPNGMDQLQVSRTADEDVFDHVPKNTNWLHFESMNETDTLHHRKGEDDVSAASSSSSAEAFLWTKSGVAHRGSKPRRNSLPVPLSAATLNRGSSEPSNGTWFDRVKHMCGAADILSRTASDGDPIEKRTLPSLESTTNSEKHQLSLHKKQLAHPAGSVRRSNSTPTLDRIERHHHTQSARAHYNARIMPDKVVMIRHGQSEGNVNEAMYSTTPDNAMRLTKLGWEQARLAGEVLKNQVLVSGVPIHFIVSPYVRTVETFHGIVSAWCDPKEFSHICDREKRLKAWYGRLLELGLTWHEDPRIREQDFGNYQEPEKIKLAKEERHRFGPFFYRFAHGESASDVFDRVSTFLDSLWRSFDLNKARNYVLVTHGISIRVLLARYFRYSIDQFSLLANPRNCEMVVLGHDGVGKLQLDGRYEVQVEENMKTGENEVRGYTFHKRLRVLPKKFVHKLNVRISNEDDVGPPYEIA